MKKIVFALVVLMLVAPASAAVIITCEQPVENEPNIIISYECTGGEVVRCIGLNIQLDNDETIIAVECLSNDYYVNPGNFSYDGMNPNFGDPACLCDSGEPDTLPGLDSNGITIALCSLYADSDPDHNEPPATSGGMVKLTVSGSACITITENGKRGGVIDEDNVDIDPTLPATVECCVEVGCECWGDNTDDSANDASDMTNLLMHLYYNGGTAGNGWLADPPIPDWLLCMDLTGEGDLDASDMTELLMHLYYNGGTAGNGWEADYCHPGPP